MEYSIFLDSGAYSAMTKGITIDIDKYIRFIKKYEECIDFYAALDVIGNPEESYKNTMYMVKKGLNPVPVFHVNAGKFYWFERLVNEFDFVGIGGMVATGVEKKEKIYLLHRCFNYLSNNGLLDQIKIHGFACTSVRIMMDFPWFSVDSTSWIQVSRHGAILVPRKLFGNTSFAGGDKPLITVSHRRPNAPTYYKKLPRKNKLKVIGYLKRIGLKYFGDEYRYRFAKIGDEQKAYMLRDEICAIYFKELEDELNENPTSINTSGKLI
jgi:hypothetical protein